VTQSESKYSDLDLIGLSLEDPENFTLIVERYELKLFYYLKRLLSCSEAELEDLLQETFLKIYQNLNGFDPKLKFSSWIYRIAHNHAISYYRKYKNHPESLSSEDTQLFFERFASDTDIPAELDQKILQKKVRAAIDKLDQKYQEVLILKFLEDKDYKEISDILKKPMGTVATLVNRAKKQFKQEL